MAAFMKTNVQVFSAVLAMLIYNTAVSSGEIPMYKCDEHLKVESEGFFIGQPWNICVSIFPPLSVSVHKIYINQHYHNNLNKYSFQCTELGASWYGAKGTMILEPRQINIACPKPTFGNNFKLTMCITASEGKKEDARMFDIKVVDSNRSGELVKICSFMVHLLVMTETTGIDRTETTGVDRTETTGVDRTETPGVHSTNKDRYMHYKDEKRGFRIDVFAAVCGFVLLIVSIVILLFICGMCKYMIDKCAVNTATCSQYPKTSEQIEKTQPFSDTPLEETNEPTELEQVGLNELNIEVTNMTNEEEKSEEHGTTFIQAKKVQSEKIFAEPLDTDCEEPQMESIIEIYD